MHQRGAEAHGETLTLHEPLAMASVSPTPRAWRENATDTPEKKFDGFDKNATKTVDDAGPARRGAGAVVAVGEHFATCFSVL